MKRILMGFPRILCVSARRSIFFLIAATFLDGSPSIAQAENQASESLRIAQNQSAPKKILYERVDPVWKEEVALPKPPADVIFVEHGKSIEPDAITEEDLPDDEKWQHHRRGPETSPGDEEDYLVSYTWLEDAPGLIFGAFVANGTYRVSVFSKTLEYREINRPSSFRLLVSPETDWRLFELEPTKTQGPSKKWFDIGTYSVTNGEFGYWLDQGNEGDFSVIGSLKFVRVK